MLLGYNTNGLAHHRILDAIDLIAAKGYESVALTLDAGGVDPYEDASALDRRIDQVGARLDHHGLSCVIETGARFLLNPRKKHDPTLLDLDPERRAIRVDFLQKAIEVAKRLGAPLISIWSGIQPDSAPAEIVFERLTSGLREILTSAEQTGVIVAFEPEPGMFIDTFAQFAQLEEHLRHPLLQVTVDIGHVHCLEEGRISDHLRAWGPRIVNIHIEDMLRGVHDHLMFGSGTIDFADVFAGLRDIQYRGGLHVELSRHSHMGAEALEQSARFLRPLIDFHDLSAPNS